MTSYYIPLRKLKEDTASLWLKCVSRVEGFPSGETENMFLRNPGAIDRVGSLSPHVQGFSRKPCAKYFTCSMTSPEHMYRNDQVADEKAWIHTKTGTHMLLEKKNSVRVMISLILPPLALIGQVTGPNGCEGAEALGGFDVAHHAHHDHWRGLQDCHRLHHLLLVHLRPGAVHLAGNVGHSRLADKVFVRSVS